VRRSETLTPHSGPAKRRSVRGLLMTSLCLVSLAALPTPALAVDGCLVVLCFAAPSWRAIPQCVPPIQQVLRDLARGRPFPTCASAGPANTASHQWTVAPLFCPPQYTRAVALESGVQYTCDFTGVISVKIEGSQWARTWWSMGGDTVTEYTPTAKSRLGTWDTRFDRDYASWLARLAAPVPSCSSC
jgi:hypothetical protein